MLLSCLLLLQDALPTDTSYAEATWTRIGVFALAIVAALFTSRRRGGWYQRGSVFGWSSREVRDPSALQHLMGLLNTDGSTGGPRLTPPPMPDPRVPVAAAPQAFTPAEAYQAQLNAWMAERGLSPVNPQHVTLAMQAIPYNPANYAQNVAARPQQHAPAAAAIRSLAAWEDEGETPRNIALGLGLSAVEPGMHTGQTSGYQQFAPAGPSLSPPLQVQELLWMYGHPWWIAGGWAIELWLGRELRPHSDVEIAIPRGDQIELRRYMTQFRFTQVVRDGAGEPGEQPLGMEQVVEPPVHELHARRYSGGGSDPLALTRLEVLLNEVADGVWRYRRDERVTLPLAQFGLTSAAGVPILAPEVVLLYKAGSSAGLRGIDEQDFAAALPHLHGQQRAWLRAALELAHPGHAWIGQL